MGLTPSLLHHFATHRKIVEASGPGATALSIGTVDFFLTPSSIRQYGVTTINPEDIGDIGGMNVKRPEYFAFSKRMTAAMFRWLGYDHYKELDISDRADIIADLNKPVPQELREKFDLVWDIGSIEHVMNINQAMANMAAMTKLGGRLVHHQGIGDQTNAGYWTISPNLLLDYYSANGFRIDVMKLWDRRKHMVDYIPVTTKSSFVGSLIPVRFLPGYYLRMIRQELLQRITRAYPRSRFVLRFPWLFGQRCIEWGFKGFGRAMQKTQVIFDWIFGMLPTSSCEWSMFFVATKLRSTDEERFPIQNIYRGAVSAGLTSTTVAPLS